MLIAGAALGLFTNSVRERPLPFSGSLDPPPAREPGSDLPAVPLEEAVRLWEQGAFCIDVRPAAEQQGLRVSGSFPVPADEFEDRYFGSVADLGTEVPLLVYGAGPDSHAVRRVVSQLRELGHAEVAFVTGGIEALVAAGVSAE
jgi:rhodanese-related sulfurtransferase